MTTVLTVNDDSAISVYMQAADECEWYRPSHNNCHYRREYHVSGIVVSSDETHARAERPGSHNVCLTFYVTRSRATARRDAAGLACDILRDRGGELGLQSF